MTTHLEDPQPAAESATHGRLVEIARRMLESEGASALTLRALAKAADLSPTAPYRHFEDGFPELLATIAIAGFEELIAVLEKSGRALNHHERIIDLSLGYVRFGVERPELYRAMFSPQIAKQVELHDEMFNDGKISFASRRTYKTVREIRLKAFAAIVSPLQKAVDEGALKSGDPEEYGLALAAMLHGLVGEFIDEGLGIKLSGKQLWSKVRRAMSQGIVELLLSGLEKQVT